VQENSERIVDDQSRSQEDSEAKNCNNLIWIELEQRQLWQQLQGSDMAEFDEDHVYERSMPEIS